LAYGATGIGLLAAHPLPSVLSMAMRAHTRSGGGCGPVNSSLQQRTAIETKEWWLDDLVDARLQTQAYGQSVPARKAANGEIYGFPQERHRN